MERLTQRCNCGICGSNGNVLLYPLYRIGGDEYMDHGLIKQCFEKLAKYEDLEEQGKTLMSYIKETYHYRADRVSKALDDLSGENEQKGL